jgi:hypothetical protein
MSLRNTHGLLFALALLLAATEGNAAALTGVTWDQTVNVQGTQVTIPITTATGTGASGANAFGVTLSIPTAVRTHFSVQASPFPVTVLLTFGPGSQAVWGTYANATTNTAMADQPITGRLRVWLGAGQITSMISTIPAATPIIDNALSVGVYQNIMTNFLILGQPHMLTLMGPGWSFGPYTAMPTTMGSPLPASTVSGSFNLTSTGTTTKGAGMLSLVSPSVSVISGSLNTSTGLSFGKVELTFAPEPSAPLLLGSGIAALALLARRRLR